MPQNARDIIVDPFMDSMTYVMGFKGDSMLYGGFLYAPYIPLFSTPTLVTADLIAHKGFMSAAGFLVINNGMFCNGVITNLVA